MLTHPAQAASSIILGVLAVRDQVATTTSPSATALDLLAEALQDLRLEIPGLIETRQLSAKRGSRVIREMDKSIAAFQAGVTDLDDRPDQAEHQLTRVILRQQRVLRLLRRAGRFLKP